MDQYEDLQLKMFYFKSFKSFCLIQKLHRLKMTVAVSYSKFKLLEKAFKIFLNNTEQTKEIYRMVSSVRCNKHSMQSFLKSTPLKPTVVKFIFAFQHYRIKTMRKYFNNFLLHSKTSLNT